MIFIKIILSYENPIALMSPFRKIKVFFIYLTLLAFLTPSLGCSYKPGYLQKSDGTRVPERWTVEKIDPARLSADERGVYERMGSPTYVRFFRQLSVGREKVYEWIYAEPVQLFTFINGKKVDYVVMDENLSSLNESERRVLFWTGIIGGSIAAAGGLTYYLTK
jgi:hypothetical protein